LSHNTIHKICCAPEHGEATEQFIPVSVEHIAEVVFVDITFVVSGKNEAILFLINKVIK
jgi:hypothetical protein